MKNTFKILILTLFLSFCFTLFASAETVVYEENESLIISKGITLTHIKKLTSKGWYNINYIEADLNEDGVGLKILSNADPKTKSTVLKMAKNEKDVVAAINADFFTSFTQTAAPEGMMIKDGTLLTSPSNDPAYATFFMDNEFNCAISNFTFDIMVTSKRTNDSSEILFYNKNADPMYLKLYDRGFGDITPGSMNDGYEVVVEDGIVTGLFSNKEGVEIPENGYVLHNSLRHSLFLSQNFQIGDEVELKFTVSPDTENIKEAVGGGTVLLKDGEITKFTLSNSVSPMTAIGIDESGKKIVFFTVDGRQTYSRGMNFTEIAKFLKELGCYNAMSFDGGGSTTLVASANGEEIKNINSQTSYRSVINAIGITAKREKGDFYGMEISLSKDRVFPHQPVEIIIASSYDEFGNHFDLKKKEIKYKADLKGEFKDNIFYPEEPGKAKITVSVDGIERTKELTVFDTPTKLKADAASFLITDAPQKFSLYLENNENYSLKIPSEDIEFSFEDTNGYIKDNQLVLTELKEGFVTAAYGDLSIKIPVANEEITAEKEADIFEKSLPEGKKGFNYSVFGINNHGDYLFSEYITGKRNIIANECDLVAFKVVPDVITVPAIKVSNYGREDTDHSLFIKLDNSKGSITSTKAEQWDWLLNVFEKGVKQKNIFINMPLDLSKTTDKKELEILTELLKENLKDKNIFIITYGNENAYIFKEGIRYITVCDIPKFTHKTAKEVIEKLKYASFTITEDDIYFEFKSLV